ncbi:hypothetical protein Tco_0975730 [Tanacetum coccineum]|uniref:Uncharacterized protein n=1 Tax=Tanacetum coccineum TaxID=301880 RepID=A0ABQ5EF95_9ASTR
MLGPVNIKESYVDPITLVSFQILRYELFYDILVVIESFLDFEHEKRVKVNQKAHILELKRRNYKEYCSDILYVISIKEDTSYLCLKLHSAAMKRRPIRRIQKTLYVVSKIKYWNILEYYNRGSHSKKTQYAEIDNPTITMKEYVQLETEKALRNGRVYNWETATYDKIWYDEDVHYLRSFETEFPAIVYNDALTSKSDFSYEPTEPYWNIK